MLPRGTCFWGFWRFEEELKAHGLGTLQVCVNWVKVRHEKGFGDSRQRALHMKSFMLESSSVDHSPPSSECSNLALHHSAPPGQGKGELCCLTWDFCRFRNPRILDYSWCKTMKHILPKTGRRRENTEFNSHWLHPNIALAFGWLKLLLKGIKA